LPGSPDITIGAGQRRADAARPASARRQAAIAVLPHPSKSLVAEDYTIAGNRPTTWAGAIHQRARPAARVAMPPGGKHFAVAIGNVSNQVSGAGNGAQQVGGIAG
jgi:hypothetical protein